MPRFVFWIALLFALVGTGMGVGAYYAWDSANTIVSEGIKAEGTVIDLEYRSGDDGATYAPVVEFFDEEGQRQLHYSSSSSNPPSYYRGETVTLYYIEGTPERAIIDRFSDRWLLVVILLLFAVVFGGVGYAMLFSFIRQRILVRRLRAHGVTIQAEFEECYRKTNTKVNGRSPWRVVVSATHPATGKIATFESQDIWIDLSAELDGKSLPVLIDVNRPDDHFVDLSAYIHID